MRTYRSQAAIACGLGLLSGLLLFSGCRSTPTRARSPWTPGADTLWVSATGAEVAAPWEDRRRWPWFVRDEPGTEYAWSVEWLIPAPAADSTDREGFGWYLDLDGPPSPRQGSLASLLAAGYRGTIAYRGCCYTTSPATSVQWGKRMGRVTFRLGPSPQLTRLRALRPATVRLWMYAWPFDRDTTVSLPVVYLER